MSKLPLSSARFSDRLGNAQKKAKSNTFITRQIGVASINSFARDDDFQDTSKLKTSGEADLPL